MATLNEQDLEIFYCEQEFADRATVTPQTGPAFELLVIFDSDPAASAAGYLINAHDLTYRARTLTTKLRGAGPGDRVTLRGVEYKIAVVQEHVSGESFLELKRQQS